MIITTYIGKKKKVTGQAKSLLLKVKVKIAFDEVKETFGDLTYRQACTKVAKQLGVTPQAVRKILSEDWEFKSRKGYPLKYTFQEGITKRIANKVWEKFDP